MNGIFLREGEHVGRVDPTTGTGNGERFLITWLPLFIIRNGWGWADEKNWQLKEKNSLLLMADLFPDAWWALALAGLAVQTAMLVVWLFAKEDGGLKDGS